MKFTLFKFTFTIEKRNTLWILQITHTKNVQLFYEGTFVYSIATNWIKDGKVKLLSSTNCYFVKHFQFQWENSVCQKKVPFWLWNPHCFHFHSTSFLFIWLRRNCASRPEAKILFLRSLGIDTPFGYKTIPSSNVIDFYMQNFSLLDGFLPNGEDVIKEVGPLKIIVQFFIRST